MSTDVLPWLEYRWWFDYPVGMFPAIRERLRGTPARLEELLAGVPRERLTARTKGKWSAQGHAGHLIPVEQLWKVRLREYLEGATTLTAADMKNRKTEAFEPDSLSLTEVLSRFRTVRTETITLLDTLSLEQVALAAHHPRLDRSLRLVDLCLFAAEHDDHHLAMIHACLP